MNVQSMTCEEVIEQLFDYLDRELDHDVSDRIDRHLERCRDCFSRAEFEKRLRAKVSEAVEVDAPDSLRRRIRRVVDEF